MTPESASIRRVRGEDALRIFEIRNHPSIRNRSTQVEKIGWEQHVRWFDEQYARNAGNHCFVLDIDDRVIGYCRFDARDNGDLRVSIAIDPAEQGKGYGQMLLSSALRVMGTESPMVAEVHSGNETSFRLFQKNAFRVTSEDETGYVLRRSSWSAVDLPTEVDTLLAMVMAELPKSADAIVWLQGDRFDRGPKVLDLFTLGYASRIVLTGNNAFTGPGKRSGENNISLLEMREWLIERGVPLETILVENQSMNTREQAEHTIDFASAEGWKTILLVASPYHQLRAFLTFLKYTQEAGWPGRIVNQPADLAWDSIPSGRDLAAREYLSLEIKKINAYREDVASFEEGITYLGARS